MDGRIWVGVIGSYAALGLAHTLSPLDTGGSEVARRRDECPSAPAGDASGASSSGSGDEQPRGTEDGGGVRVPKGFGRIVRDDAGNVVDVELGGDDAEGGGELGLAGGRDWVDEWDQSGAANITASAAGWLLQDSREGSGPSGVVRGAWHIPFWLYSALKRDDN